MAYKIIPIIILLVLSAFFSGAETAIFSMDALKLKKVTRRGFGAGYITRLLENPLRLLVTILTGNMVVNIAASSIAGALAIEILGNRGIGVSIAVMTFLLLIFGEITPKRFAVEMPERFSVFSARILFYLSKIFFPVYWVISLFSGFAPRKKNEPTATEEELKTVIDIGHQEGVVAGGEKELIGAVLGFTDMLVRDVMTPQGKIKAVSRALPKQEFINTVKSFRHSKVPVYVNSLDNIMGVVYAKDLLFKPELPVEENIKPVLFTSENSKIKDLLYVFEREKIKIAMVKDEDGKITGLITMEDIVEEVFGEIYDEYEIFSGLTE